MIEAARRAGAPGRAARRRDDGRGRRRHHDDARRAAHRHARARGAGRVRGGADAGRHRDRRVRERAGRGARVRADRRRLRARRGRLRAPCSTPSEPPTRSPSAWRRSCCWSIRAPTSSRTSRSGCWRRSTCPSRWPHHEAFASEVELRTPVCRTAAEAARLQLDAAARRRARGPGRDADGGRACTRRRSGATCELTDKERYRTLDQTMRGLIRRTPECALHVHVGAPDPEAAIRHAERAARPPSAAPGAGAQQPVLVRRGLRPCERAVLDRARLPAPRRAPLLLADWDEYAETVQATGAAGDFDDYTFIWWDVRAHPRLGTVEVREMDVQPSLEDAAALAALVQALAARALESPPRRGHRPPRRSAESSFRASRDGLDATILHDGALRPLREVARATVASVARPRARARLGRRARGHRAHPARGRRRRAPARGR